MQIPEVSFTYCYAPSERIPGSWGNDSSGINSPGVQMYRRGKKKRERERKYPVKNVNTGRQESKGKKWALYLLSGFELMQLSCFF